MYDPSEDFGEVFFAVCKSVNTAYALSVWLRWKYREMLTTPPPRPELYDNATDFGKDYLVYSWASKAQIKLDGRDPKSVALDSFIADESFNEETTRRLTEYQLRGFPPRVESVIFNAQRKIASVLGPFNVRKIVDCCRFGNGASNTLSRRKARYDKKITTLPLTVSASALPLAKACIESDPAWLRAILKTGEDVAPCSLLRSCFAVTDYNTFDTVPKSLKTDRAIAKEPVLNGFLQQGVHIFIRRCLKRVGIDLQDQRINQELASLAQEYGLATIDLKSASNSVTLKLAEILLPYDWFEFLVSLRSRQTLMPDGTLHRNFMLSSMGNAFTFEIETLFFWALTSSVCTKTSLIAVYGDDIICPQLFAADVIETLETCGFRINLDKSFVEGRFFESCGKHYFDGTDVTPVYQKKPPRLNLAETLRSHNRLMRWATRSGYGFCLDSTVYAACSLLARGVDRKHHGPIGPERDDFLQVPYGTYRVHHGNAVVHTLKFRRLERRTVQAGSYAYWLRLRAQPGTKPPEYCEPSWSSMHRCSRERILRRDALSFARECGDPWLELSFYSAEDSDDCVEGYVKTKIPMSGIQVELAWA